jgi:hypothetical protein
LWTKYFFYQCIGLLIEAYGSLEKYWLVCVGLLVVYQFYEGAILHHGGLLMATE